jgi:lipopolysaccharide transport system permease protein
MTIHTAATKPKPRERIRRDARALAAKHSAGYLVTHRGLLLRVARTELAARYAGSLLGLGWAILAPLSILGIYAAIYLVIFPFQPEGFSSGEYVLYIFCGLAPFLALAEAMSLGVGSVVANKSVLSNVIFPIDLVPAKAVLSAQVTMAVGMVILLVGTAATRTLSWTALLVPALWFLFALALIGLVWVLSLLNIVFRDLQNLVTMLLMILLIASPFAYTPEMVPDSLEWVILLNPFAYFVIGFQKLWVLGELPSLFQSTVILALSLGGFFAGGWFFARSKSVLIDYV